MVQRCIKQSIMVLIFGFGVYKDKFKNVFDLNQPINNTNLCQPLINITPSDNICNPIINVTNNITISPIVYTNST